VHCILDRPAFSNKHLCRFEQLEAFARSQPQELPFHQLLSRFADSAQLSAPYFLADMANMVALARVLRHLEASPEQHLHASPASAAAAADDDDKASSSDSTAANGDVEEEQKEGSWGDGRRLGVQFEVDEEDESWCHGAGAAAAAAGLDLEDMFTWCTAPASADDPAVLQVSSWAWSR
jgi:hypothetical protein